MNELRDIRVHRLGWTQQRAAREACVSVRTYARYEAAKPPPGVLRLMRLLARMEVPDPPAMPLACPPKDTA